MERIFKPQDSIGPRRKIKEELGPTKCSSTTSWIITKGGNNTSNQRALDGMIKCGSMEDDGCEMQHIMMMIIIIKKKKLEENATSNPTCDVSLSNANVFWRKLVMSHLSWRLYPTNQLQCFQVRRILLTLSFNYPSFRLC